MIFGPSHQRPASLLSAFLLAAVFTAGALSGAALLDRSYAAAPTDAEVPSAETGYLTSLDLSSEQRTAIDRILTAHQPVADSIVRSSIERLRDLMNAADAEVRAVLSPQQILAYEELLAERPRIRAVRRTVGPDGITTVDTIR